MASTSPVIDDSGHADDHSGWETVSDESSSDSPIQHQDAHLERLDESPTSHSSTEGRRNLGAQRAGKRMRDNDVEDLLEVSTRKRQRRTRYLDTYRNWLPDAAEDKAEKADHDPTKLDKDAHCGFEHNELFQLITRDDRLQDAMQMEQLLASHNTEDAQRMGDRLGLRDKFKKTYYFLAELERKMYHLRKWCTEKERELSSLKERRWLMSFGFTGPDDDDADVLDNLDQDIQYDEESLSIGQDGLLRGEYEPEYARRREQMLDLELQMRQAGIVVPWPIPLSGIYNNSKHLPHTYGDQLEESELLDTATRYWPDNSWRTCRPHHTHHDAWVVLESGSPWTEPAHDDDYPDSYSDVTPDPDPPAEWFHSAAMAQHECNDRNRQIWLEDLHYEAGMPLYDGDKMPLFDQIVSSNSSNTNLAQRRSEDEIEMDNEFWRSIKLDNIVDEAFQGVRHATLGLKEASVCLINLKAVNDRKTSSSSETQSNVDLDELVEKAEEAAKRAEYGFELAVKYLSELKDIRMRLDVVGEENVT